MQEKVFVLMLIVIMAQKSVESTSSVPMYDFSVLRALRKREEMTLGEVSERSGISVAVISKLERNQSKAELDTLFRLARVFGMSATDLLGLAESRLAHRKNESDYSSHGFHFKRVRYANMSCFLGEAPKKAKVTRPEIHHDDYETCWVLKGRIKLTLPHETYELTPGESIQFDAIQEHAYEALEDSQIIIIHVRKDKRF